MPGIDLGTGHRSGVSTRLLRAPGNLQTYPALRAAEPGFSETGL